tara:strand:- start:18 stop:665 length:648 start_codon:yes stop_codon:yes gene_type:complete
MSEIQSVNVFSVDEERLKFRVIVGFDVIAAGVHQGEFNFLLPPPTNFANNSHYSQALIKLDSFTACPVSAINDPAWTSGVAPLRKESSTIIEMSVGSSQTNYNFTTNALDLGIGGQNRTSGFRQLVPLQIINVGTPAVGTVPSATGSAWVGIGSGISATDPLLSANPFGQKITIRTVSPISGSKMWLHSIGAGQNNVGDYSFQFTVTMIPNNRSS